VSNFQLLLSREYSKDVTFPPFSRVFKGPTPFSIYYLQQIEEKFAAHMKIGEKARNKSREWLGFIFAMGDTKQSLAADTRAAKHTFPPSDWLGIDANLDLSVIGPTRESSLSKLTVCSPSFWQLTTDVYPRSPQKHQIPSFHWTLPQGWKGGVPPYGHQPVFSAFTDPTDGKKLSTGWKAIKLIKIEIALN